MPVARGADQVPVVGVKTIEARATMSAGVYTYTVAELRRARMRARR